VRRKFGEEGFIEATRRETRSRSLPVAAASPSPPFLRVSNADDDERRPRPVRERRCLPVRRADQVNDGRLAAARDVEFRNKSSPRARRRSPQAAERSEFRQARLSAFASPRPYTSLASMRKRAHFQDNDSARSSAFACHSVMRRRRRRRKRRAKRD